MKQKLAITLVTGALLALPACGSAQLEGGSSASGTPSATATASPSPSSSATASVKPTPTPSPTPSKVTPHREYWEDVEAGMCVVWPKADEEYYVKVVDCSAKHNQQVLLNATLAGSNKWPGDAAIDKLGRTKCKAAFTGFVGIDFGRSRLDVTFYTTDKQGWIDGDHTIICLISDPRHPTLTKSLEGSRK